MSADYVENVRNRLARMLRPLTRVWAQTVLLTSLHSPCGLRERHPMVFLLLIASSCVGVGGSFFLRTRSISSSPRSVETHFEIWR
jgi:hypothetical protein